MVLQFLPGLRIIAMLNSQMLKETVKRHYRVDRRKIAFIRFIIEAYDGLAIVKTLDAESGLVEFQIAPGCERDVESILQDLQQDILMEKADL
jgi:hypothetical protein